MEPTSGKTATTTAGSVDHELSWTALLAAYRAGPRERWSEVLIERLGPWLTRARQRLVAVPPYIDDEDIAQQLVFVVLRLAARWRPRCEDHWVPRKLVEAAERRARVWLSRETACQADALDEELPAPERAEPELVLDTPIGQASVADLRLIFRVKVLGEPIPTMALAPGITPRQMRRRVQLARQRARAGVTEAGESS
jgi:hypothetical protein